MIVKAQAARRLRAGYPLLTAADFLTKIDFSEEKFLTELSKKDFVQFFDEKKKFLGTGYLSKQNKGVGWLLSRENRAIDALFYAEKFAQAKALRQPFFADDKANAFRLFNGEGDGLGGLTVDFYAGFAVFSWYNEFIYAQSQEILIAFLEIFPEILGIYEKIRFDRVQTDSVAISSSCPRSLGAKAPSPFGNSVKNNGDHIWGEKAPEPLIVKENGVNYATYLDDGLMTGIFLDQKNVRATLVNGLATEKRLLNMFSYTGAFSVAAAVGGASQTTSVDLAKRSLDKTREQFFVNGIAPESQKIYVMDVFSYFNYAKKKQLSYDIIVLDPPSFARNGKKTFSVAKNYGELVEASVDILAGNGILIASTNAANVSREKFRQSIEQALRKKQVKFDIFQEENLPADFHVAREFPEGDYLKVLFIKIKK